MRQLSFPFAKKKGFEVHKGESDFIKCSCGQESNLLVIYFRMGHYNVDDNLPNLIGHDCPFGRESLEQFWERERWRWINEG